MSDQLQIEPVGEHRYLVSAIRDGNSVQTQVYATPSLVARYADLGADEPAIVQATIAFLVARQRVDDLPQQLDLDDVVAVYDDFEAELRRRLSQS